MGPLYCCTHTCQDLPSLLPPRHPSSTLAGRLSRGEDGWRGAADFGVKATAWPWHRYRHGIHPRGRLRADGEPLLCLACFYVYVYVYLSADAHPTREITNELNLRSPGGRSVGRSVVLFPPSVPPSSILSPIARDETERRDETLHAIVGATGRCRGRSRSRRRGFLSETRHAGVWCPNCTWRADAGASLRWDGIGIICEPREVALSACLLPCSGGGSSDGHRLAGGCVSGARRYLRWHYGETTQVETVDRGSYSRL